MRCAGSSGMGVLGALLLAAVAEGCWLEDKCFDRPPLVLTAGDTAQSRVDKATEFCRRKGLGDLHTMRSQGTIVLEICCYRDGII